MSTSISYIFIYYMFLYNYHF